MIEINSFTLNGMKYKVQYLYRTFKDIQTILKVKY